MASDLGFRDLELRSSKATSTRESTMDLTNG